MYGGLFGDLPETRGSSENPNNEDHNNNNKDNNNQNKPMTSMFLPQASTNRSNKKPKMASPANNQIAQAVGAAGTSFAFVPTTIKRKRPNRFSKLVEPPKTVTTTAPVVVTNKVAAADVAINNPFQQTVTTSTTVQSAQQSGATPQPAINIHDSSYNNTNNKEPSSMNQHQHQHQHHQDDVEEEEEIIDPYDPCVPNDLLQYWDRQALAQERAELERETREALEKQRMLRLRCEQEREELQRKGDYAKIMEQQQSQNATAQATAQAMGRGRGRGVSNIPAWLVEKQRREQELGNNPSSGGGGAPTSS